MDAPQTDRPQIGLVGRMARVFYAPGEAFEALSLGHSKMDWLVPAILVAIAAGVVTHQVAPLMMKAEAAAMEERLAEMPAEQREMAETIAGAGQTAGLILAPIMALIAVFIAGGLLLLLAKILGGEATYGQMLSVYAYGSLISLLKSLVTVPLMVTKQTVVVQTGLGLLMSDEMLQTFFGRFVSMLELFTLWQAAVTAIGLSIVAQISTGKAFTGIFVILLILVAIGAAVAGLSGALGG